MKNIKCTIEARMGSKRLPGKSMKFLKDKFRLIDFVILNALNSKYLNSKNIYLLTSKNHNNKILVDYVKKKYRIKILRGPEENVYKRYSKFKGLKNFPILRLTADNALIDPLLIDKVIEFFFKSKADYVTTRAMAHSNNWREKSDFPKGISVEVFNSVKFFSMYKNYNNFEYLSPTWFFFNKKIKCSIKKVPTKGIYKKLNKKQSFTIDTKSDYEFVKKFIKINNFNPGLNNFFNLYQNR